MAEKILKEIVDENFPNLTKDKPVDSRNWENPKEDKSEEIYTKK